MGEGEGGEAAVSKGRLRRGGARSAQQRARSRGRARTNASASATRGPRNAPFMREVSEGASSAAAAEAEAARVPASITSAAATESWRGRKMPAVCAIIVRGCKMTPQQSSHVSVSVSVSSAQAFSAVWVVFYTFYPVCSFGFFPGAWCVIVCPCAVCVLRRVVVVWPEQASGSSRQAMP